MEAKTIPQPNEFFVPAIYDPSDWEETILIQDDGYTYEDYEKLPEGAPYQLIGGDLVMTPAPALYHQEISGRLFVKLHEFIKEKDLGYIYYAPVDVYLTAENVYQPDILFIRKNRSDIIKKRRIMGPPDIVIEILSPSTAYYDLREKFKVYEQCGVQEYWIIDHRAKKIEVYNGINKKFQLSHEAEQEGVISSKVLDNLKISLSDVF